MTLRRTGVEGVTVDLNAVLLKEGFKLSGAALANTVDADETTTWYVVGEQGGFVLVAAPPDSGVVALLVRTPEMKEPAWHLLLRDHLRVEGFGLVLHQSSGAILFVPTDGQGLVRLVAWCFGQGSRWIAGGAMTRASV